MARRLRIISRTAASLTVPDSTRLPSSFSIRRPPAIENSLISGWTTSFGVGCFSKPGITAAAIATDTSDSAARPAISGRWRIDDLAGLAGSPRLGSIVAQPGSSLAPTAIEAPPRSTRCIALSSAGSPGSRVWPSIRKGASSARSETVPPIRVRKAWRGATPGSDSTMSQSPLLPINTVSCADSGRLAPMCRPETMRSTLIGADTRISPGDSGLGW